MKIGILTFHDTTNFGSFLQTFGLYKAILDLGHDCEIIDYKCEAITRKELPKKKPEKKSFKKIAKYLLLEPMRKKKYLFFQEAYDKYLKLSQVYYRKTIHEINDNYDMVVTGSDILWDLKLTEGDTTYFLDFISDSKKKYAFSTSIGNPWEKDEKSKIKKYLNEFQRIAIRESLSLPWVEELTKLEVDAVCDPTMLLTSDIWNEMADAVELRRNLKKKKYVLTYFFDDKDLLIKDAIGYAKQRGYEVYTINYGVPKKGVKNIHPYKIEEFLALVRGAQAVFTASYHGMMFALYFEREVYAYSRSFHSIRFDSVIQRLELQKCFRTVDTPFECVNMDYERIRNEIKRWREESLLVLESYFGKEI